MGSIAGTLIQQLLKRAAFLADSVHTAALSTQETILFSSVSEQLEEDMLDLHDALISQLIAHTEDHPNAALVVSKWENRLTETVASVLSLLHSVTRTDAFLEAMSLPPSPASSQSLQRVMSPYVELVTAKIRAKLMDWFDGVSAHLDSMARGASSPRGSTSSHTDRMTPAQVARLKEESRRRTRSATSPRSIPQPPPHRAPGETPLGVVIDDRYRVISLAGRGGVGVVYKAEDTRLNQVVAVKMLSNTSSHDDIDSLSTRFRLEAETLARLKSPFTVRVHDHGEWNERPYLVMEFVEGRSVTDLLRNGPLPPRQVVRIAHQICHSIGEAHALGRIHRDLKPANILIQRDLHSDALFVKVVDFGLTKDVLAAHQLTTVGTLVGTPQFMSPEQAQGQPLDHRSDLYSLGIMMFYMLTRTFPYDVERPNAAAWLFAHVRATPRPLTEVAPRLDVPPRLQQAISWCLAKDPAQRCSSAQELMMMLRACKQDLAAPIEPSEEPSLFRQARSDLPGGNAPWPLDPSTTAPSQDPPSIAPSQPTTRQTRQRGSRPSSQRVQRALTAIYVGFVIGCVTGVVGGVLGLLLRP
ncbi:MAG: serine/threonine protein kinase [Myxococcales bacterium]|nr:serine/threonine protein kinase [Myxococcales bacterium]